MKKWPSQILLEKHLRELKIEFKREFYFYDERKWRADYLLVDHKVLFEIEGGVWGKGRHTTGKGFEQDCLKYATATMLGYRVLRFTTQQVLSGQAREFIKRWLC